MADYRAVPAVSETVIELLRTDYQAASQYFNNELKFQIGLWQWNAEASDRMT